MEHPYQDRFWNSADGLRLHYRDYPGREDRPPLLCLHGLTRNSRDFAGLAERYAGEWRVIAPDMRGRGDSDHAKDSSTYALPNYLADLELLFESEGIGRFVAIGTSMGGLLTMLLAATNRDRIVAALLNDVGPEVETGGIEHIRSYLGQQRSFPTWIHAARAIEEVQRASFPDNTIEDWLAAAKRSMVLGQNGRITFDYDMAIAEPFNASGSEPVPDLWPAFEALAGRPLVLVRGEISRLLSAGIAAEMQRRVPDMEVAIVPRVGHAPTLSEPPAIAALDRMLARIA